MRIDTLFTPGEIDEPMVKGKTVAVIDVLRASTTICYAMSRGCERVIPVGTVEAATNLASSLEKKLTVLGGEREGKRIDGFDLGNSPLEYTSEAVKGRTVILTTTNGTRAISLSQGAREIVIASFVNMSAVCEHASKLGDDPLTVVCAGEQNRFALEDAVCAGMLVERLCEDGEHELGDGAGAARLLYRQYEDSVSDMLARCEHGRYLESIGFAKDLQICSKVDRLSILPTVKDGRVDRVRRPRRK
jgi:2-phosphosulfolactate phosphatase